MEIIYFTILTLFKTPSFLKKKKKIACPRPKNQKTADPVKIYSKGFNFFSVNFLKHELFLEVITY